MKFCWLFFSLTLITQFRFSYTCNIYILLNCNHLYVVSMGLSLRAQGSVIFPTTISMNPTILTTLSWDTPCCTHIPTKSCVPPSAPSIPVLIFLLLTCPLPKTNIDGAENTTSVPTNVMSIAWIINHLMIWNLSDRSVSNLPLIDWLTDWLIDWLIDWLTDRFRQTQEWVNLRNMEIQRLEVFYMSKIFSCLEGKS